MATDIAVYISENGEAGVEADANVIASAAALNGKYITDAAVTVAVGGIISVPFDAGVLAGQTMTLSPTINGGQISQWTCAGLDNPNHLPSGCTQ
ncbi:pilin [Microbulbifer agarilyticus]|nr:pilin [Microbulbifer agarilyticus]